VFLDTCVWVDLLRERNRKEHGPATRMLASLGETEVLVSVFVLCELRAGAKVSANPRRELTQVSRLVESHPVIYPDSPFAVLYGEVFAALLKNGTPIPVMDLLVGVTAKRFALPVLTRDVAHFEKIPGLVVVGY
jgi:tRNA(fMet)-specific endonuclease VapC